jgi:glycosyltransferase involved in cell wall biosynthesis
VATRIACVSDSTSELREFWDEYETEFLTWPEQGVYGDDALTRVTDECSRIVNLDELKCVVCENLSSAPLVFELRRNGYGGPVVLIPHINAYPTRNLVHALLCAQVWGQADRIIAGSGVTAERYETALGMTALAIPTYGVDTRMFFQRGRRASREELGLSSEEILVYTGRFARDKNIGALLLAYDELRAQRRSLELVLAISFRDDAYWHMLEDLRDGVRVFDKLGGREMGFLYSAADLFLTCSTSYYETFGRSPLEAIACGTPVLLPDWDGFRSHVDRRTGMLAPVDVLEQPLYDDWSYSMVDLAGFVTACGTMLDAHRETNGLDSRLTFAWTREALRSLVGDLTESSPRTPSNARRVRPKNEVVTRVVQHLGIADVDDLLRAATCSDDEFPDIDASLRRELYLALFA